MKNILLAEDDFDYASILKQYLEIMGFAVTWAKNGTEAMQKFIDCRPDICVLDVMMPTMDGFTLAENLIEKHPEVPFIFLTAKNLKEDKIRGLKLGADDYIVKPFEADELILRINNIIKRSRKNIAVSLPVAETTIGNYIFNPGNFTLSLNGTIQRLTEREAHLIAYLIANKKRVLKREEILREVWGSDDFFSGRSMDVFISRLRRYFSEDTAIKLEGIRGIGLEFTINTKK